MLIRFWNLFVLLVGGAACLPAAVLYSVTDLGGNIIQANAINNAGQVTGSSEQGAFLYSNGIITDLGTLPGTGGSVGYGINDAGQVTGSVATTGEGHPPEAFLYSNGVITSLSALPSAFSSQGFGINNAGQIGVNSGGHAVIYSNGVVTDLGALPVPSGYPSYSFGFAINNAGQVTGFSITAGGGHAFLYSNGVMTDLGTLPGGGGSRGFGINNAGQIVGDSITASGAYHAFLYSDGVMTDLNDLIDPNLHITLTGAGGINNSGQILSGRYLLTPVPEPGTWALLGAGLLLVAALARSYKSVSGNER